MWRTSLTKHSTFLKNNLFREIIEMKTGFGSRELKSVFLFSDGEKINWYVFYRHLAAWHFVGSPDISRGLSI